MATLKKLILPVKSGNELVQQEFDLPTPVTLGFGYGSCSTAYIQTAKAVTITNYDLAQYGIVSITFVNAVPSNATLSINGGTAYPLYHRGNPMFNGVIFAGDTATFIFDGHHFNLIALDRQPTVTNKTMKL